MLFTLYVLIEHKFDYEELCMADVIIALFKFTLCFCVILDPIMLCWAYNIIWKEY